MIRIRAFLPFFFFTDCLIAIIYDYLGLDVERGDITTSDVSNIWFQYLVVI